MAGTSSHVFWPPATELFLPEGGLPPRRSKFPPKFCRISAKWPNLEIYYFRNLLGVAVTVVVLQITPGSQSIVWAQEVGTSSSVVGQHSQIRTLIKIWQKSWRKIWRTIEQKIWRTIRQTIRQKIWRTVRQNSLCGTFDGKFC